MRFLLTIIILLYCNPALAQGVQFFETLEDIPLMAGLEEIPAETFSFDKPEGRIIESYARLGSISIQAVSSYYEKSLPAFGWGRSGPNRFFRKNEHLEITFETHSGQKYAKITIRPSL